MDLYSYELIELFMVDEILIEILRQSIKCGHLNFLKINLFA